MALGLAVAIAGCASQQPQTVSAPLAPGAIDTGTYPNLNVPPQTAAAPISTEEKAGLEARIGAAHNNQAVSGSEYIPPADAARMRRLATQHGDDTLKQIEAK